ncbi:MAG: stress response translation initiation inhibitor YciH [Candidatus Micrarchaeota archaeon]
MSENCPNCGLPKEICACQTIEKETTGKLKIYSTKKRFNKLVTIVEGLDEKELKPVTKELKRKLACGGNTKEGIVVLQGDHVRKVADYLVKLGYPRDMINVTEYSFSRR